MFTFTAKFLLQSADDHILNGFSIMPLDEFVKGSVHTAADDDEDEGEDKKDDKSKKDTKTEKKDTKPKGKEEPDFGFGAQTRELPEAELTDYLNRSKENREQGKNRDMKDKATYPIIHGSNVDIVDEEGNKYDLAALKVKIMQRPSALLRKNEKMQHSDGTATQYYNIGLPALKGLVVNEKTGKFVIVDTCPGAGICKTFCYAMRGNYVRVPQTSLFQAKVLNFLVNHPDKFKARLKAEIGVALADADDGETEVVIRWHDAGDFFSPQYLAVAYDIARAFPEVKFYAYTKIAEVANSKKPDNFIINFSEGAKPEQQKLVNLQTTKHSVVVPQKMFWDLIVTKGAHVVKNKDGQVQFKNDKAWNEFKDRLMLAYKIPKESMLIYDQYMDMKRNDELGDKKNFWNVIIPPGGGDNAANDPMVHGSYLMWH